MNDSRSDGPYQSSSYQPLSAYRTAPPPPQSSPLPTNLGNGYNEQGYGNQIPNAGFPNARTSVDTSALGNLAYASSLGRDGSGIQSNTNYNRYQSHSGYGHPAAYGRNSPLHLGQSQQTDSGGSTPISREGSRPQSVTASNSLGYPPNPGEVRYQGPRPDVSGGQGQAQSSVSQQSWPSQQQVNLHKNPPSRPSSGQALQHPQNRPSNLRSPSIPVNRTMTKSTDSQQHSQQRPAAQILAGPRAGPNPPATAPTNNNQIRTQTPSLPAASRETVGQSSTTKAGQSSVPSPQNPQPGGPSNTTVDPSNVFNDVEYQRRQAAIAAEANSARKKAEDARLTAQAASDTKDIETGRRSQMELEMRTMFERLRDLKSTEPGMFSEIWEQAKKEPVSQRAPSQAAPQGSDTSPVVRNGLSPVPSFAQQLPPESELPVPESFPSGFDRGRFPAQRRRRGGSTLTPRKSSTPKGSTPKGPTPQSVNGTAPATLPNSQTVQETPSSVEGSIGTPITPAAPATTVPTVEQRSAPVSSSVPNKSVVNTPPQPLQKHQQPQPPKPGGTYWPEHKKHQLAEAAKVALSSMSRNASISITADEFHKLLDQNPSFTQLCEILEYRGFALDRGQFARLLLSAVPDLSSASEAPPPPPTPIPVAKPPPNGLPGPVSYPSQPPRPYYYTPYKPPGQVTQAQTAKNVPAQPPNFKYGQGGFYPVYQYPSGPKTAPLPNIAKNSIKPMDNRSSPGSIQRLNKQDMARKRNFSEIVDLAQGASDDDNDDGQPPNKRLRAEPADEEQEDESAIPEGAASRYINSENIVRPIDKQREREHFHFNPKTIARDILLAVGEHPTMAPLNAHLTRLKDVFTHVNDESDLSTFKWDLVDPGGPPLPVEASSADEKILKSIGSRSKDEKISSCIGLSSKDHQQVENPRSINPGPTFDFSRFVNKDLPVMLNPITGLRDSQSIVPNQLLPKRKGGRPPGAKNKNPRPDKGTPRKSLNIETQNQKEKVPQLNGLDYKKPETPASRRETPSQAPIGSTPTKTSRLRNAMTPTDGIAVVIPSRSPSVVESRPSQKPEILDRYSAIPTPAPTPPSSYKSFKCRWERCPAELHSLETLKKHIRKHRNHKGGFNNGPVPCLWDDCASSERKRLTFESEEAWLKHIEGVHVIDIARVNNNKREPGKGTPSKMKSVLVVANDERKLRTEK